MNQRGKTTNSQTFYIKENILFQHNSTHSTYTFDQLGLKPDFSPFVFEHKLSIFSSSYSRACI